MDDHTDRALARRAAAGDGEAFAALLERHYDRIYRNEFVQLVRLAQSIAALEH